VVLALAALPGCESPDAPGAQSALEREEGHLTSVGSTLYFLGNGGKELWKSDGTADGTIMLKSFSTGAGFSRGAIHSLTALDGTLFFTVASSTYPFRELWRSDGSKEGTVRVSTVLLSERMSQPELVPLNGAIYFHASDGMLWRTDGVETTQVRDIDTNEGSESMSTGPSVTLTSPTQGSFLRGIVWLDATATGSLGIARVEFYDGATLIGTDYSSPYSFSWRTEDVTDGAHALSAKAFDLVGQVGTSAAVGVTVDNSPPETALGSPAQNAHVRGTIQLSATASDNLGVAKVEFYDGAALIGTDYAAPYELSWNTTSTRVGIHHLTSRAFDLAGNITHSAVVWVIVDNHAPRVTISGPSYGAQVRGSVLVSATAFDNEGVARVEFYVGTMLIGTDSLAPYEASWNSVAMADGVHTLTAKAYDAAGNEATSDGVEVLVDNTAPTVALNAPAQSAYLQGTVQLSATASDNVAVAGVEFYDGPTLLGTDYAPPYTLEWNTVGVREGGHLLTARAFDNVGNVSTSAEVAVTVDNTAPAVALSTPAQNALIRGIVLLGANASDTLGVARVEFYVDGTLLDTDATAPYELSWNSASIADGAHLLMAKAYDLAGNSSSSTEVTVTVDNTAPATALTSPAQNTRVRRIVQVSATASDHMGVARVEFYANGAFIGTDTTAPYDVSWDTASGPDGSITLTTQAYDLAGNVTLSAGVVVWVDNTAPTVAITSPANGASLFLSTTIEASAGDNVGVAQVVFYDGATVIGTDTTAPYSVNWNLLWVPKGSHTLTAKAYDVTGNVTTSAPITVTVN
jgi:ELWxxDGT repeat protein